MRPSITFFISLVLLTTVFTVRTHASEIGDLGTAASDLHGMKFAQCRHTLRSVDAPALSDEDIQKLDLHYFSDALLDDDYFRAPWGQFRNEKEWVQYVHRGNYESLKQGLTSDTVFPWAMSLSRYPEIREIAVFNSSLFNAIPHEGLELPEEKLREYLSKSLLDIPKEELDKIKNQLQVSLESSNPFQVAEYSQGKASLSAICATYGVLSMVKCVKSLGRILELMAPKQVKINGLLHVLSQVDLFQKALTDPVMWEGARLTSLKVLDRMSGKLSAEGGDLFTDIVSSFRELGLDETAATDKTWDLLTLYSARGANIGESIMGLGDQALNQAVRPFAVSMHTIATGMAVLDARLFAKGATKIYSLPKEVVTTLDNAKPYHFWMSASLTRQMTIEMGSTEGASSAVWISQLGYQMRSTTLGREPLRAFMVPSLSSANHKIRMDLVYASAGISYGSKAASGKVCQEMNIDQGMKLLLQKAESPTPLKLGEAGQAWGGTGAEGYFRWKKIFSPDSVFDFFK